jgi:hypothetical protein
MYANTNSTSDKSKGLRSKCRSSPCIFQVVVSLSIRIFRTYFLIIFSCFQSDFSVKSIKFSTRNSKYFIYILQQLLSMRRTHVGNSTWINSIYPELCPPLTYERACSGNEIVPVSKWGPCARKAHVMTVTLHKQAHAYLLTYIKMYLTLSPTGLPIA